MNKELGNEGNRGWVDLDIKSELYLLDCEFHVAVYVVWEVFLEQLLLYDFEAVGQRFKLKSGIQVREGE